MTTYSISLDDVDLAFLPLRTHKYNDFLKKEHFQFQVLKKDNVQEPVPTVFYTCHVCAIEVPAAFASEHAASIKHRANARIASVAMQRTHKLISSLPLPSETIRPPSGRFCTNCAIVTDEDHNKTKEHRVAAIHDNLLWDLMKAYIGELGDQELKDDYYKDNMNSKDQGLENHKKIDSGCGNDGKNATVVSVVNKDPPTSLSEITHNNDRTEEKDGSKAVEHNRYIFINDDRTISNATADAVITQDTSKKQKGKKTKSKPPIHEAIVSNCETVSIKNLEKHNKNEDFTKLENRQTNDKITKRTEFNTGNNNIVDTSERQDVIKNIRDPNALKQVDKTVTKERSLKQDNKNEVTQSTNHSIVPSNSRVNLAPAKITDEITNTTYFNKRRDIVTNETKTWEQVAEYFERKEYTPYETELARTCNNKNAEFQEANNKMYIKVYDDVLFVEKDNFHSYLRVWGNFGNVECLVCGLVFDNGSEIFHTHSKNHRIRISDIGEDNNYVRKISDLYSHCILCNTLLWHTSVFLHNQDFHHIISKEANNISTIATGKEQQATFKVTNKSENRIQKKYIPVILTDTDDEDENETNDDFVDLKIEYPFEAVLGEMRCVICDCKVPRTIQNRIDHTNGSRHAKNMKKKEQPRSALDSSPWDF